MGSLVENDFMKHATHLKEFHYRIGVLRHPMDTVVCVGKYLKEGGSEVRLHSALGARMRVMMSEACGGRALARSLGCLLLPSPRGVAEN